MDADIPTGVGGGANQNHVASGTGRNPNGPTVSATASAAGAMPACFHPREQQDGEAVGLSLPGILHFIQFEWGRFQSEKYRWEAERDELRAQVAFLQGEERAGEHEARSEKKPETKSDPISNGQEEFDNETTNQMAWKEGRQLLRKYLEEVGYSDTILNMRSKRVKSLLGRCSPEIEEQIKRNAGKEGSSEHSGRSVLDKIPFLRSCEDEDDSDEDDDFQGLTTDCIDGPHKNKKSRGKMFGEPMTTGLDPEDEEDEDDSEDALSEFDFLGSGEEGEGAGEACISGDGRELGCTLGFSSDVFILDTVGGGDINLGELADLTVANDFTIDHQDSQEDFKKTWNPRFTLRSHFDAIRSLTFHPSQPVVLTASEDGTLKLWNLNKTMHSKKGAALDFEPIYTFRGHSGAVLSLAMGEEGKYCYSGGLDGSIRCWKSPDLNVDPYDNYDQGVESAVLLGHEDAVWDLAYSSTLKRLASCSADGTVRIWDPQSSTPCITIFNKEQERGTPTSIAFGNVDLSQAVVSFDTGETVLYDLNTEQSIMVLEAQTNEGNPLINCVVSHPSQPISITAHENRNIRFLDNKTGKVIHSMVAHLDAVTCLTTDPKGSYLISGSHDCSVRLWMLDNRTCVQEITAHRKKHDEAIHDVAFHPSQPLIASAGADSLPRSSFDHVITANSQS
ncbi:hypothetical protein HF521_002768 [Silurus meridionalis]|uniref:Striatin N-terminal domain-containing protein n=1 Tax=Silurus meridionalis TaxID=175797 RepID=A0A8T0B0Z9_SILME|nr:hypothetical protein HF521_002768 [Silurus meridionalis]